ncbi:MAG: hypothetical protein KAU03_06780, partial [Candidatus Altiarchaeales archaeon]|nr:hypothetical protein [Candidatus Altiarchaeales archaeon]
VWIDHQYVEVWTETESSAIDPDVKKLRYRTELKIGSTYESVSVEVWNWKTLKWETLWGDLHHMSEQVHTWDTISLDYLSADGDMKIRYYYHQHQPPRVWIDHQYVRVWMGTTSGTYDPGIVKMQYPTELKIGSTYESVSVQIWNWKTLKWETLWGDLHNKGERIHTYTWETGSMEDYLNAEGDMKIRYYYHQHQPPRVWNDFQEIIVWWPCTQTTTTTITTTTITTTTTSTTTTSTSTIPTAHTFTYNATDDHSITSCSLWTDTSGSWQIDQTDEIIINGAIDSFTIINTLSGAYKWNVECVDDASQSAFAFNAPQDWTFTVS